MRRKKNKTDPVAIICKTLLGALKTSAPWYDV